MNNICKTNIILGLKLGDLNSSKYPLARNHNLQIRGYLTLQRITEIQDPSIRHQRSDLNTDLCASRQTSTDQSNHSKKETESFDMLFWCAGACWSEKDERKALGLFNKHLDGLHDSPRDFLIWSSQQINAAQFHLKMTTSNWRNNIVNNIK